MILTIPTIKVSDSLKWKRESLSLNESCKCDCPQYGPPSTYVTTLSRSRITTTISLEEVKLTFFLSDLRVVWGKETFVLSCRSLE